MKNIFSLLLLCFHLTFAFGCAPKLGEGTEISRQEDDKNVVNSFPPTNTQHVGDMTRSSGNSNTKSGEIRRCAEDKMGCKIKERHGHL